MNRDNTKLRGYNIIFIAGIPWSYQTWQRPHQLMSRLAEHNRVIYVFPLKGVPFGFRRRRLGRDRIVAGGSKVTCICPSILPLGKFSRIVARLNSLIIRMWFLILKLSLSGPLIVWVTDIYFLDYVDIFADCLKIYDCQDEWLELWEGIYGTREELEQKERLLLRKVQLVLTVSEPLCQSKAKENPHTYLVRNGADLNLFAKATVAPDLPPAEFALIKGCIIGFIGTLDMWIDTELIIYLAQSRPEWAFVFLGPVEEGRLNISPMKKFSNIYILGTRPYAALPGYLYYFDVCIIPFKLSKLTMAINPIKVYEYLAAGKPVVATDLPEVASLGEVVHVASGYEDFLKNIEALLKNKDDQAEVKKRITCAQENSWESRISRAAGIINKFLEAHPDLGKKRI